MADKKIICKVCGTEFLFTERDQAFFAERGYTAPQSCRECRAKRKAEQGGFNNRGNNGKYDNKGN